jgi:cupin 2 domain-containing protein
MAWFTNFFADIPADLPEELIQPLLSTSNIRIERIISLGHTSPDGFWYDQETHEWVLLVKGAARLRFEGGEPIDLRPGSFVNIPAHKRHLVEWTDPTQPTIWLAVQYWEKSP